MSESTYEVNLRNPHTATINLAAFYNSVRLDAGKRIGLLRHFGTYQHTDPRLSEHVKIFVFLKPYLIDLYS